MTTQQFTIRENKRPIGVIVTIGLLLLIPLIAMQFTNEVKWTPGDFFVMAVLLLGTGLMCEFVMRKVTRIEYRIGICLALLAAFLLTWMEMAVGIFGTPFAGS